jgi:ribosomal protein S18 acetylase RimI-like enzyme
MKLQIRSAELNDAEKIALFVENTPPLERHTTFAYWVLLHTAMDTCFLAEHDKSICGFLSCVPSSKTFATAYLWQLGVSKTFSGISVANELVCSLLDALRAKDIYFLRYSIDSNNRKSMNFMQRSLFRKRASPEVIDKISINDTFYATSTEEILYQIDLRKL